MTFIFSFLKAGQQKRKRESNFRGNIIICKQCLSSNDTATVVIKDQLQQHKVVELTAIETAAKQ